ncbi:MAG: hypothetical protein ABR529_07790 [Actinomycetota bacterium]
MAQNVEQDLHGWFAGRRAFVITSGTYGPEHGDRDKSVPMPTPYARVFLGGDQGGDTSGTPRHRHLL